MQAIVVEQHGGPEVLQIADVADPAPGVGEVEVRVHYAGLNFVDTYHRTGLYPLDLPFTPGQEGAGEIIALGDGVEGFSVGDKVAWTWQLGSYAQSVAIPADRLVRVPDGVGLDVAAALLLQGLTAHYLARDTFPLTQGDRCVIHAAAGGVGRLLVQIAKLQGAVVFATAGTDEKVALAIDAGADHAINYSDSDFVAEIEAIAGPKAMSVVYDGVGAATFDKGLGLLEPRGLMVAFGNASGPVPPLDILRLSRGGSLYVTRPALINYIATPAELRQRCEELFSWVATGKLEVHIGATFALADAADAHRALEGRGVAGKILLEG